MAYLLAQNFKIILKFFLNFLSNFAILVIAIRNIVNILQLAGRLRNVDVSHNKLESLPAFIGELINLKQLHVNNNQLVSLPDEIGQLKKLDILVLQCNQLSTVPDTFVGLTALKTLNLSNNKVKRVIAVKVYQLITVMDANVVRNYS